MAAKAKTLTVEFSVDKETKNTVRYKSEGDPKSADIAYIYISRGAVKKLGSPDEITVEVRA